MFVRQAHVGILVLVAGLAVGCGGGSSAPAPAPSPSAATFSGTYTIACLVSDVAGPTSQSVYGTMIPDGAGAYSSFIGSNMGGMATAPANGPTGQYVVGSDGTLTIDNDIRGGLALDGLAAVLGSYEDGSEPAICFMLRRVGSYGNGILSGDYHSGYLGIDGASGGFSQWTTPAQGFAAFDGAGVLTYPVRSSNAAGTLGMGAAGATTYSIAAAGDFVVSTVSGNCLGGVTTDGSFAVASGALPGAGGAALTVFVRKGAGLSNATFRGDYWLVSLSSDSDGGNAWSSIVGLASVDGAGVASVVAATANQEGVVGPAAGSAGYSVASDGTLTIGNAVGGISPDGRFGYTCGQATAGGDPVLEIYIRR